MRWIVFPAAPLRTAREVLPHTALHSTFVRAIWPLSKLGSGVRSCVPCRLATRALTHGAPLLALCCCGAFPHLRFCCPEAQSVLCPAPTPSSVAAFALPRRVSPVPCSPLSAFRAPYAGGFFAGASQLFPASVGLRPLGPGSAPPLTSRSCGRSPNGAAGFALCYGLRTCSPTLSRALSAGFDAGLSASPGCCLGLRRRSATQRLGPY